MSHNTHKNLLLNAQNCSHSLKQIRNKSVYCLRLDQWVSTQCCEFACRAYTPEQVDPSTIPPEETVDNSGPVRDENGKAVDVTEEDEAHW